LLLLFAKCSLAFQIAICSLAFAIAKCKSNREQQRATEKYSKNINKNSKAIFIYKNKYKLE
jgi:hypothetical protein